MLSYARLLRKPLAKTLPNIGLQLTAYSVRSAPAFGSS